MQTLKPLILALILTLGLSYVSAATWSGPNQPPPQNNVDAPINVSDALQEKIGVLKAGGIQALYGFKFTDGNEAEGKVLTSDSEGNASWQSVAGGGSSSVPSSCSTDQIIKWDGTSWACSDFASGVIVAGGNVAKSCRLGEHNSSPVFSFPQQTWGGAYVSGGNLNCPAGTDRYISGVTYAKCENGSPYLNIYICVTQ